MEYSFFKTDNTIGALKVSYILSVNIITRNKNQSHRQKSYLRS